MDYVKGRPSNYKSHKGTPALMESSVNQDWSIKQSTNYVNSTPLPSGTSRSLQDVPQEQLPSSSTISPAPTFAQPLQTQTIIHDTEMYLQPSRKKLRLQPNVTYNNNKQVKSKSGIQVNREGDSHELDARTRLEQLQLMDSVHSEPDLHISQNHIAPPKPAISATPKIHILHRKENTDPKNTTRTNIHDIYKIFKSVIDGTFNNLDFEISQQNFYEICSFACSTAPPKEIFDIISTALHDNIVKICRKMEALASEKVNFLSLVGLSWKQCLSVLTKINDLFNSLNSKYIIKETKYASLFHFGKSIYVNMLSTSAKIKTRTINSLTRLISSQRHQMDVNVGLITSILQIMHENLPIYVAEFGQELTQSTRRFYRKCAVAGLKTLSMESYVMYALKLFLREPTVTCSYRKYIPENIESPCRIAFEELLSKQSDHIANCFELTVEQGQEQVLKALYQLFTQHGDISLLQTAFEYYIMEECNAIYSDNRIGDQDTPADDQAQYHLFVSGFITLKDRLHSMLDHCFDSNDDFRHSLKKCFEESINRDQAAFAQYIASYMNQLLESIRVFSTSTHSSTLKVLDQCIDLFRNVQAEDVFKSYYKAYLARRLLMDGNKSVLTKEQDMADRLESECGVDFAKDLFGMITEVRISQQRMANFEEVVYSLNTESQMQLSVNVLSGENWSMPIRNEELRLTSAMLDQQRLYNDYYRRENPRIKLTWMASVSTCVLDASYPNCTIQLHTSQYQAMILLLFNRLTNTYLTVKRISEQTGIGEEDVLKSLKTLTSPDIQLLIRRHESTELANNIFTNDKTLPHDGDEAFAFNQNFSSTKTMISLPNILGELTSTTVKVMNRRELFNKQERLQASIMNILKKHKSLDVMDIWTMVKEATKNGPRKLLVRLSSVENELQVLVQRCLIRNITDDLYEYCEE